MTTLLAIALSLAAADAGTDPGAAHAADVDRRGDHAMGFSHEKTAHHFGLTQGGGFISAETSDPGDEAGRAAIRRHFRHIADAFKRGDFAMPMFIHGREPPGVAEMKRLAGAIEYRVVETPSGARVVVTSSQPRAIAAIHDFLRFQIEDHRTGDSVSVQP